MANPTRAEATATRSKKKTTLPISDILTNAVDAVADTVTNTVSAVQNISANIDSIGANVQGVVNSFTPENRAISLPSSDSYKEAVSLASRHGIGDISLQELLGSNPYLADANIPLMDAKEANEQKMAIQRQNNALSVRSAKIDQNRKVLQLGAENNRLIGDAVKVATSQIEVGTNFLENQIADTNYLTKQSKLEQSNQYLEQQQIATQGTISLTPGIREEWALKFQKLEIKNQNTRLQIQGAIRENEITTQMLEAKLLEL